LIALRVVGIGVRLVARREVLRDVAHALLAALRRRGGADLVPARLVRRIRRIRTLARATRPSLRRAGTAHVPARRVLHVERKLVARGLGLGNRGEPWWIGNLDLREVDGHRAAVDEVGGELVLAGVAATDRVDANEVLALRVVD